MTAWGRLISTVIHTHPVKNQNHRLTYLWAATETRRSRRKLYCNCNGQLLLPDLQATTRPSAIPASCYIDLVNRQAGKQFGASTWNLGAWQGILSSDGYFDKLIYLNSQHSFHWSTSPQEIFLFIFCFAFYYEKYFVLSSFKSNILFFSLIILLLF